MTLMLHVFIALLSIVVATYAYIRPTRPMLRTSYILAGATLATGTYLIVSAPAHMLQACISGVAYLTVVSILTVAARIKLTKLNTIS